MAMHIMIPCLAIFGTYIISELCVSMCTHAVSVLNASLEYYCLAETLREFLKHIPLETNHAGSAEPS